MAQFNRTVPGCIYGFFLLIGLPMTGISAYQMIWLPLRVQLYYQQTDCIVLDKRLEEQQDAEGGKNSRPQIQIEYTAGGKARQLWTYDASGLFTNMHDGNQAILNQFQKGKRYPCWYDPGNPDSAVVTRSFDWGILFVLIPFTFVCIGAGGLIYTWRKKDPVQVEPPVRTLSFQEVRPALGYVAFLIGGFLTTAAITFFLMLNFGGFGQPVWQNVLLFFGPFAFYGLVISLGSKHFLDRLKRSMPSPERAAALPQSRLAGTEPESTTQADELAEDEWPTIPDIPRLDAGKTLAYRLNSGGKPIWILLGVLFIAAFWNGIVSIFVYQAVQGFLNGKTDWFLTIFMIPFVLVGLALILVFLFALLQYICSLIAGSLSVEIARHPLYLGPSVDVFAEQSGLVPLKGALLTLKCFESASYTEGTTTRTETKEVLKIDVLGPEPNLVTGLRGTLTLPEEAMHSFESAHNKISWTLDLHGKLFGLIAYGEIYPIIVRPGRGGANP